MLHPSSELLNMIQVSTSALAQTVNRRSLTGSIPVSMGFMVNKVALERGSSIRGLLEKYPTVFFYANT